MARAWESKPSGHPHHRRRERARVRVAPMKRLPQILLLPTRRHRAPCPRCSPSRTPCRPPHAMSRGKARSKGGGSVGRLHDLALEIVPLLRDNQVAIIEIVQITSPLAHLNEIECHDHRNAPGSKLCLARRKVEINFPIEVTANLSARRYGHDRFDANRVRI